MSMFYNSINNVVVSPTHSTSVRSLGRVPVVLFDTNIKCNMNILINVMAIVSLVIAPLLI